MIKFNDTNIIVGYIKQLLSDFNLPIDITNLSKQSNRFIDNYDKHLLINNIYYDSYTHRYLGDYLRYLRDRENLNLMQMYNCFSNETVDKLPNSSEDYKYYCVRVLPNTEYTIAISCSHYQLSYVYVDSTNTYYKTAENTSEIIKSSSFDKPYILKTPETFTGCSSLNDCRLIIKLPVNNKSSIVILEGNYIDVNEYTSNSSNETFYKGFVTNFEKSSNKIFRTRSQLLLLNSGVSFPFADKLISYLLGNVITHQDNIGDNIERLQQKLQSEYSHLKVNYPGIWDNIYSDYINYIKNKNKLSRSNFDVLGYVDKDIEKTLGEDVDIY